MFRARGLLTFMLVFAVSVIANGQQHGGMSKHFSFRPGAAHWRFIDEAFSHERVKYLGTNITGDVAYERVSPHTYLMFGGGGVSGSASAPGRRADANTIHVWLAATFARRVLSHSLAHAAAGFYLGAQASSSNFVIENVDDHDEASVATYQTLNLFMLDRIELSSKNRLQVSLSMPVAGFVKRQNYDGGINQSFEQQYRRGAVHVLIEDSRLKMVNPFSLIRFDMDFTRSVTPAIDLVLTYRFSYLRNRDIAPVNLYGNSLALGFRISLNTAK